jgi:hypothetical protein
MAAAASRRFTLRTHHGRSECERLRPDTTFAGPDRRRWSTNPSLRRRPGGRRFGLQTPAPRPAAQASVRTSRRVVRRAPSLALREDGCTEAKNSDTSRGVRCLSTKSVSRIVAPTCLTGAVRSQGFSPSQRFDPLETSWLCFTPHPSIGFPASRASPAQPAAAPLDARYSLAVQVSAPERPKSLRCARSCGFRALLRLSIRHPADRSPPGRCSPGLSPLRGLPITTAGPRSSRLALHLRKVGCARPSFIGLRPRV